MPIVSIVTPIYNAARWLPETLASVRAQTFTDWEHLLVDDGSADESVAIVERAAAQDERVRLLHMPENGGPSAARNLALDSAQGRYIALLDADDVWLPEKLTRCIEWMTAQGYGFIYHDCRQFYRVGEGLSSVISGPDELNMYTLHTERGVRCFAVVIDRERIPDLRFPLAHRDSHEDFIAWLSLIQKGYIGHRLSEDLGRYRLSHESRNANKYEAVKKVWRIYRDVSNLPLPQATSWWMQYAWNAVWLHRRGKPVLT